MNRLVKFGTMAALVAAAGCKSIGNEYVYDDAEGQRAGNREMVTGSQDEQTTNGVIRQKTVYPYQFVADAPALNELGEHDLTILAKHYKDNVLPFAGSTKVLQEVKVFFDYNKSFIRPDAHASLEGGLTLLDQNAGADIIITGRADQRGSEDYNDKLAARRAEEVRQYLISKGGNPDRVKIVSRGKLDAAAPTTDEPGMQLDRHAVFQVAEMQDFPVNLNVKQGAASDELYDARLKAVRSFLESQGVDTKRIALTDGLPGGDGMPSQQAVIFLIDSYTSDSPSTASQASTVSDTAGGLR